MPRVARLAVRGTQLVAVAALAGACSTAGADVVRATPQAAETATPAAPERAVPPPPEPPRLGEALSASREWTGTAAYELRARGGLTGQVTVTRAGDRLRVDVAVKGMTTSLMTAEQGWVACAQGEKPTCVTVAGPGEELPAAWDPGVGRIITSVVPGLAARDRGTYGDGYVVASGDLPAAACVEVVGPDTGRYCVAESGVLRRAKFTGGTLSLLSQSEAADAARFVPAVAPTPLG